MGKVDLSKKQADLRDEEFALALAYTILPEPSCDCLKCRNKIANALLRTQKTAYLLGQIAELERSLAWTCGMCGLGKKVYQAENGDWWHLEECDGLPLGVCRDQHHQQSRLRDLRADLEALEQK
jgi:hypothetical protein